MIAQLISIGNEITGGQTVDTNSAWLAQQLAAMGIRCVKHTSISDELEPIRDAILLTSREADLILITGGLGPTPDDLTREALAAAMNAPLAVHEESLAQISAFFERRGRPMHAANRQQAMLPHGAISIANEQGTAPGIEAKLHRATIFCMPGVPYEMKAMWQDRIRLRLGCDEAAGMREKILRTFGMSESELGERIGDLMRRDRNPTVGTSAAEMIISIRVVAEAQNGVACEELINADVEEIRKRLGEVVYGEADESLASAVAQMLIAKRKTISTAESCTGGLVAKRLTDISGSSAYFLQGFITYSNEAKTRELGVPADLIQTHGAVSAPVAEAMAAGCRQKTNTDFALAITGIAGPTGGTSQKPVGLVFVALATPTRTIVKELRLGENLRRDQIRDRTAKAALNLLRLHILRGE